MKIGELSRRTGVPTRLLRYYEEQDLLHPERTENGYRFYGEPAVLDVQQIRGLLDSGLTTEMIRAILPYLSGPEEIHVPAEYLTPETAALLSGLYRADTGPHRLHGPQPRPARRVSGGGTARGARAGVVIPLPGPPPDGGVGAWIMPRYSPFTTATCARAPAPMAPAPVSSGSGSGAPGRRRVRVERRPVVGPGRRGRRRGDHRADRVLHRARPRLRVEALRPRPADGSRTAADGGRVHARAAGDPDGRRDRRTRPRRSTPGWCTAVGCHRPRRCRPRGGRPRRPSARTVPGCAPACSTNWPPVPTQLWPSSPSPVTNR